ncbi:MAG TPA: AraC family transcriptional regulator [Hanamia sp.]|nr:AraC family transcriptional regulator [Hanamia sp.]
MIFEFTASLHFDFITEFSKRIEVPVYNDLLLIPANMGKGYVRKVTFGTDFRLLVHRYNLKEELVIKRNPAVIENDLISIFFYNNEQPIDLIYNEERPVKFSQKNDSAVQVTTNDLSSVIRFPSNTETQYLVVGITSSKLASLIGTEPGNNIMQTMTAGVSSFLYFESMNAEIRHILKSITAVNMNDKLSNYFVQIKVQELLYHLMTKLSRRENTSQKSINNADAEKLLVVRSIILEDLSEPPLLHTLSTTIGMSETKLKQLFKQTFGETIYNYYQKIRMEEAAFLLKQAGYSVSEVGYQLGFSNLSHFSRLFQKHYGITPKKYSSAG